MKDIPTLVNKADGQVLFGAPETTQALRDIACFLRYYPELSASAVLDQVADNLDVAVAKIRRRTVNGREGE
ncbi:hypothetical protein [Streptomyces sp. 891-h]|uniref:hypothetical protein n=1 Tax=Streptomyces sp. 891-h TaxID=2720714 RepID=UPI001FAA66F3|nr:hypothetical protein [Streptomyces sp. 891-h]UNZ22303.1 hypothetical protein HC362_34615 [Streptomyces sp. 891-h]